MLYVTAPDTAVSDKIASALVERKLAACVNTLPNIKSTYWWEGKVGCVLIFFVFSVWVSLFACDLVDKRERHKKKNEGKIKSIKIDQQAKQN